MSESDRVFHSEPANVRDDIKDVEHDGTCPTCSDELVTGYGLAGGGIGVYEYCERCRKVVSKTPDPE